MKKIDRHVDDSKIIRQADMVRFIENTNSPESADCIAFGICGDAIIASIPIFDLDIANRNPDQYMSKYFHITLEHYLDWKEAFIYGLKCSVLTKTGKPCKGYVKDNNFIPNAPNLFIPKKRYYCEIHKNRS